MKTRTSRAKDLFCSFFIIFSLSIVVTNCGYTIQGKSALPFSSISIDTISNRTYEPRLDDKLRNILTEELIKRGFVVDRSSDYRIYGSINVFELRTLSEKAGVAVEYEVVISGEFKVKTSSGIIKDLRSGGLFIVSLLSAERIEDVMALKEKAIEKALKDLSEELIISIYEP